MKKAILTISALMIGAMISTGAFAAVPDLIPVQGVLADSADAPVDALTDMTFTLYDGESSSTVLWTDTFVDVDVVEGFFTVYLGDNVALDFGSLITNAEVWVGITVETDPEMDRFQLATVPFAIEAQVSQQVGSLTEGDIITTSDPAGAIVAGDITNWDTAYGWGDHSTVGYLTTETDPVFGASAASGIAAGDITSWDTAYGWGNHAGLYAPLVHTHDWSTITGIPAGFADGIDNYAADTNAATICANGYFLNGDGSCDAVTSGDITGVTAGAGLTGGGTSGTVAVSIPANGVTSAMHAWGVPMNLDIFSNAPTTSCTGSAVGGSNHGSTTSTTNLYIGNVYYDESNDDQGLRHNYTRARLQITCRGSGTFELMSNCSTVLATVNCQFGVRPWSATSAEFAPSTTSWNLRVRASSGTVEWANPTVILY